ncbi:nucleotidyltransferase [Bacillus lacus]|uniref:tRNA(Met) cytidine acetate ligase n=1 Tax=Metabacillus lacus TaxID=1983721 RepID=A0A7X2IWH9_9BACI|nr:nucleotidyltransferase [Metabacillus lacus]
MRAVGIVVEYNPFHNGHLYHVTESKRAAKADVVIAVMSGNFLQRGEPALVSKWNRTKMALEGGVDLVVELPYAYATQKAESFANGAISILEALKCTSFCFGSENGDISSFTGALNALKKHQQEYDSAIKGFLKEGFSYPKSLSLAYKETAGTAVSLDLSKPNNILGYHYVKAAAGQEASIEPQTIVRTSAGYHDEELPDCSIASATSIRKAIFSDGSSDISQYVPKSTEALLSEYREEFRGYHNWESYFHLLKYMVSTLSQEELRQIYEVEEGLENRINQTIYSAENFHEWMNKMKTKRYTWTRLQRLSTHLLTKTTKQQMKNIPEKAPYIRLLGMSKEGQAYLSAIKKSMTVPVISKLSAFQHPMLELDKKAGNVYASIFPEDVRVSMHHQEYSTPPLRYNRVSSTYE